MLNTIVITRHPAKVIADHAQRARRVLLGLGALLCIVGLLALLLPTAAGVGVNILVGAILMGIGVVSAASSMSGQARQQRWRGVLLGIIATVVGLFLLLQPVEGTVVLAGLLAAFFLADGVFGLVAASQHGRGPATGAITLGAIVSLLLGLVMLVMLPTAAPWLLGVLVGIHLLADGVFSLMLASKLKK